MKKIITFALVAAGALVLGGCSLYGGNANNPSAMPGNMPSQSASSSQSPAATGNMVSIQNFTFSPAALTISKGTTVTWTNNDSVGHQIKSDTFNSNLLSKGQSFSFTFNDAGTFNYSCAIHPSMLGKIVVQ